MDSLQLVIRPRWLWGLPAPIWVYQIDRIRELVERWNLKPLSPVHIGHDMAFSPMLKAAPEAKAAVRLAPWRIPFPGGLKFAHLHLDDRIFALDDEQWKEFSTSVVDDMRARLDHAGSVNVRQLTELSELILEL